MDSMEKEAFELYDNQTDLKEALDLGDDGNSKRFGGQMLNQSAPAAMFGDKSKLEGSEMYGNLEGTEKSELAEETERKSYEETPDEIVDKFEREFTERANVQVDPEAEMTEKLENTFMPGHKHEHGHGQMFGLGHGPGHNHGHSHSRECNE